MEFVGRTVAELRALALRLREGGEQALVARAALASSSSSPSRKTVIKMELQGYGGNLVILKEAKLKLVCKDRQGQFPVNHLIFRNKPRGVADRVELVLRVSEAELFFETDWVELLRRQVLHFGDFEMLSRGFREAFAAAADAEQIALVVEYGKAQVLVGRLVEF